MPDRAQLDSTGRLFLVVSSFMLAHQVAGKAVRDGLFLSRFSPADLPRITVAAAILALLLGLGFSRVLLDDSGRCARCPRHS